ncbi:MAG: hypothetical protein JW904_04045 [Spirochaetales bacterium]|nr:hypothetical protein [Spirochaetales bacterium]
MKYTILFALTALVLFFSCGEDTPPKTLVISDRLPVIDGTIRADEYTLFEDLGSVKLSLVRSENKLCAGLSGKTENWISVGVGSSRMDGAVIFIGYVRDGKTYFSEERGKGHGHTTVPEAERITIQYAMKEENEITSLEVECDLSGLVSMDTKEIRFIIATGEDDSFSSPHAYRRGLVVTLQ